MQSTGQQAWSKHFKGKGNVKTVAKKEGPLYDPQQPTKQMGRIQQGQEIVFMEVSEYQTKTPVMLEDGTVGLFPFNNVQKPVGKRVSGVKLKPQDFPSMREKEYDAGDLAKLLINDIEERQDLEPDLKQYLIHLTGYHANLSGYTKTSVSQAFDSNIKGLAEIKKDYGEILGALACVKKGILSEVGITVSKKQKVFFPWRGNEPIVDYFIIDPKLGKIPISAKSGTQTNTLKPSDVIELLEKKGLTSKWKNTSEYKLLQLMGQSSIIQGPFLTLREVKPRAITKKATEEQKTWKQKDMTSTNYTAGNFASLISTIPELKAMKKQPTIGEMFFFAEKYIINVVQKDMKMGKIFQDATSGMVVYIRYDVKNSAPHGEYDVMASDLADQKKVDKIKLRSKNSKNRAADRIGIQP